MRNDRRCKVATTLKKKVSKVSKKASAKAAGSAEAEAVDRFITLKARLDALESERKEFDSIKKRLATLANEREGDRVMFRGTRGAVVFGPRQKRRTITDMRKAVGFLRRAVEDTGVSVWDLLKVNLGLLDDYLTPAQREAVIDESRTGTRGSPEVIVNSEE